MLDMGLFRFTEPLAHYDVVADHGFQVEFDIEAVVAEGLAMSPLRMAHHGLSPDMIRLQASLRPPFTVLRSVAFFRRIGPPILSLLLVDLHRRSASLRPTTSLGPPHPSCHALAGNREKENPVSLL
jgi:hypothetical protein